MVAKPRIDCGAAVCGRSHPGERLHLVVGEGWEGIIAAPRWSLCIWNLPELIICAPPWDAVAGHQAQEIYSPAERRGRAASVPRIVEITNQMHAGLIACRQGETFGTLIIKLKLNLNCKFFFFSLLLNASLLYSSRSTCVALKICIICSCLTSSDDKHAGLWLFIKIQTCGWESKKI